MIKIAIISGDGIGKEVMDAALLVLDSLDLNIDYYPARAGKECFETTGTTILEETLALAKKSKAILFGAVTSVPNQKSAIISLRKELDLYANFRPIKSYPKIASLFSDLDFVIVRENTEGMYSGLEEFTDEGAVAKRVITHRASKRISEFAFEYAQKTGRKKVTAVHKANVLKKTDGVFKDSFYKVAREYPNIQSEDFYVDATAMYFITKPHIFDVVVTTNLFGDILSDEGAGLVGGLGLIPSANIGDKQGLFEPVHGSAPDIAGKGIANPSAMLLSTAMMLKFLKKEEEALMIEKALLKVFEDRKILTPDLGGKYGTMDMAQEVIKHMEAMPSNKNK